MPSRAGLEVRCFCEFNTLLAVAGRDDHGRSYLHIKAHKSVGKDRPPRLFAEVIVQTGVVRLRCRDCRRWHKFTIKTGVLSHTPERLPAGLLT